MPIMKPMLNLLPTLNLLPLVWTRIWGQTFVHCWNAACHQRFSTTTIVALLGYINMVSYLTSWQTSAFVSLKEASIFLWSKWHPSQTPLWHQFSPPNFLLTMLIIVALIPIDKIQIKIRVKFYWKSKDSINNDTQDVPKPSLSLKQKFYLKLKSA